MGVSHVRPVPLCFESELTHLVCCNRKSVRRLCHASLSQRMCHASESSVCVTPVSLNARVTPAPVSARVTPVRAAYEVFTRSDHRRRSDANIVRDAVRAMREDSPHPDAVHAIALQSSHFFNCEFLGAGWASPAPRAVPDKDRAAEFSLQRGGWIAARWGRRSEADAEDGR